MNMNSEYVSGREDILTSILSIRKLFVGSIFLGGILIFMSVFWANAFFSMLFPVLIMGGYIAVTFYKDMDLPKTLIGDSYYYLGFIFTLIALVASLLTLNDREVSIGAVVGSFGAALLTTIIGLTARLMITTFSTESAERSERLEQEIENSLDRFSVQLELMTTQVITSVTKIVSETDMSLNKTLDVQRDTQERFSDLGETIALSVDEAVSVVNEKLNKIEIDPNIITTSITSSFDIVNQNLMQVTEHQEKLNVGFQNNLKSVESFNTNAEEVIKNQLLKSSSALNDLITQKAKEYNKSLEEIGQSILSSFGNVNELKSTIENEWRLRVSALSDITNDLSGIVKETSTALNTMKENIFDVADVSTQIKTSFKVSAQKISEDEGVSDVMKSLEELAKSSMQSSKYMEEIIKEVRNSQEKLSTSLSTIDETVGDVSIAAVTVREDLSRVYKELAEQISQISNYNA